MRRGVGSGVWLRGVTLLSLLEEGVHDKGVGGSVEHTVAMVQVGDTDEAGEGLSIVGIVAISD